MDEMIRLLAPAIMGLTVAAAALVAAYRIKSNAHARIKPNPGRSN